MKEIRLRNIRPSDRAELYAVYASTREEELSRVNFTDQEKEAFLNQQFDAQQSDYTRRFADADYLAVLDGDRVVGRLYVHRTPEEINILDIALLPEYRGRGIGTSLLLPLLEEADATGRYVRLFVLESNSDALRLYRKLGFKVVGGTGVYLLLRREPGAADTDEK